MGARAPVAHALHPPVSTYFTYFRRRNRENLGKCMVDSKLTIDIFKLTEKLVISYKLRVSAFYSNVKNIYNLLRECIFKNYQRYFVLLRIYYFMIIISWSFNSYEIHGSFS